MTDVTVLRLGHRPQRDKRLTTHVCLTARAFGADRVLFPQLDDAVRRTVEDVVERFGGSFELDTCSSWRSLIRGFEGTSLHLTMYGRRHDQVLGDLDAEALLVVVGASKVPREVYDLVDVNLAVGNQPHSEVAALAVTLHEVLGPEALTARRPEAEVRVLPSARGKRVVSGTDDP